MRRTLALALVAVLVLSGCAGLFDATPSGTDGSEAGAPGDVTVPEPPAQQVAPGAACDYVSLYDRTIDSVVAVRADGGLGSGFVYGTGPDNAGYLVTNAHVVGDAESVVVQFARDQSRAGTVVARDDYSDLAVIRVAEMPAYADALPVAAAEPVQGQRVAALGNPFGYDETITHGIVSGLNRSLATDRGFTIPNVVQTDAPISSGNSGGPLVTCDGTVVGVTTAGIAASSAENIGFAIAPTTLTRIIPALVENGEYDHAYLGVTTTPITPPMVEANAFETTRGVYVHEVADGGPSDDVLRGTTELVTRDGQQVPTGGDVIVAIGGQQVASGEDLASHLLTETRPGDTVALTILRDGERRDVEVTLGERPAVDGS